MYLIRYQGNFNESINANDATSIFVLNAANINKEWLTNMEYGLKTHIEYVFLVMRILCKFMILLKTWVTSNLEQYVMELWDSNVKIMAIKHVLL